MMMKEAIRWKVPFRQNKRRDKGRGKGKGKGGNGLGTCPAIGVSFKT
jgi:hypothetical protein